MRPTASSWWQPATSMPSGPRRSPSPAALMPTPRWEEMLERERLDLLWVCTPPLHHRAPVVAALAEGVNVYLEKPVARTLEDAEAIVAAASAGPGLCTVGYQWHATELLDDVGSALGEMQVGMLLGRNYGPVAGRPWFMDQRQGGGQILERGSHHIDLQRAIAGEIVAVEAIPGGVRLAQPESGVVDRRRDLAGVSLRERRAGRGAHRVVARRAAGGVCHRRAGGGGHAPASSSAPGATGSPEPPAGNASRRSMGSR